MRQFFFTALLAGLIVAPAGLSAQEVYKEANASALGGYRVILDLTVKAGMPAGAVTGTKKYTDISTASNSTWLINPTDNSTWLINSENGSINATMYEKLEIAPGDLNNDATFGAGTAMDWANAYNRCKNSTYDGGGWRLPTQRELMMMWIFRLALNGAFNEIGGLVFVSNYYWSATENYTHHAWCVHFDVGGTYTNGKTRNNQVRCVREL